MKTTLKAVLVGCGNISKIWLAVIKKISGLQITGLVDVIKEKAENRAKEFGLLVDIGSDLSEILKKTAPDIVFDCTTPDMRLKIISTAFEFGCHVLVEKPLASSLEQANEMVSLAKEKGRICATMQNHRFNTGIRRLENFIQSGELGEINQCNSSFYIGARFEDFRKQMKHVLLQDMAVHTFDTARFILGADPVSVYCKEWNPIGSWYEHDASAVAIFQMTKEIIYTYQGSWCSQGLRTPWESQWRINGTRGSITWDGSAGFKAEVLSGSEVGNRDLIEVEVPELNTPCHPEGHEGVIRNFIDSILNNRIPETICDDNIKSLQMVFSAIESSVNNKFLEISK